MRKAANLKHKYAPIPVPVKGTKFTIDELNFTVKDVSLYQNESKEYVAQCAIDTPGCRMLLLLTSSKPFLMEEYDG